MKFKLHGVSSIDIDCWGNPNNHLIWGNPIISIHADTTKLDILINHASTHNITDSCSRHKWLIFQLVKIIIISLIIMSSNIKVFIFTNKVKLHVLTWLIIIDSNSNKKYAKLLIWYSDFYTIDDCNLMRKTYNL